MTPIQPNRLQRQLSRMDEVPAYFRPWFQSVVLGRAVPYTGTSKLRYEVMSPEKVVISVANRHRVQNHIEGVHAVATTLAAETATGMVMGMNVRDDCVPVVKDMRVQFKKRGMGAMRAVATLTPEQRALMQSTDKGEVTVAVVVTDESGNQPVECEFIWAWIPSKRPAKEPATLRDSEAASA
jgi:acyl-coenzyme A thioesterase PaaI-like protein